MNRLVGLSLWLVCVGCASSPALVQVRRVDIVGNHAVTDGELTSGLAMHGARGLLLKDYVELDEVSLARDRERITAYYRQRGYFAAKVVSSRVKPYSTKGLVDLVHEVVEGPPTRITSVELVGVPPGLLDRAVDRLEVARGDVYDQQKYLDTKDRVRGLLIEEGHAHAKVAGSVVVAADANTARVRLIADAGPVVTFGATTVQGLERVPQGTVRARVAWEEGDRFDPKKIDLTKGRLYQLGYLSSVRVDVPHEGSPEVASMTIVAREAKRHEVELGGGVALDNANTVLRPRFGFSQKGLIDPLLTLRVDARPGVIVRGQGDAGQLAGDASVGLERTDLMVPRLRGTVAVVGQVSQLETYSTRVAGVRLGLDRPFAGDHVIVGLGGQLRFFDFTRVADVISPEERERIDLPMAAEVGGLDAELAILDQSIALDLRDQPIDPHQGIYVELRAEEGDELVDPQRRYVKLTPELRAYVAPIHRLVLAGRVRYGSSVGTSPPITQRFFSGGASNHRGFTYRRLSPMTAMAEDDGDRIPIGGATLLETSGEVRLDVFKVYGSWLGVVGFVDAGDVVAEGEDPTDLHVATGGGLRYDTIVGPVRFDVGYRLNRYGEGEPDPYDRWAFHLSLGEAF